MRKVDHRSVLGRQSCVSYGYDTSRAVHSFIAIAVIALVALTAILFSSSRPPTDSATPPGIPPHVGPVFDGRRGDLTVVTPRRDARTVIDGVLTEPEWATAALLTGFSQYSPTDGVAAKDSTEVLVWYSPTALHVGIRAFAAAGTVRATLADRDKIAQDDNVQLFLGTYGDSRQALVFAVNPLGIQSDGVLNETGAAVGNGFSGGAPKTRESVDLSPDYLWKSKGHVTEWGYEVEIEIPFKSLRYSTSDVQQWQLHVLRTVQATGFEESWAPAQRAGSSFLAQSGRLSGLRDLRRGLTLDVIPTITTSAVGTPNVSTSKWNYATTRPAIGGSVRWGVTSNLTVAGTANPDFSQVEADATLFSLDPRVAVFFAERRPFFLESLEQFTTPSNLIYTRRISQPVAAVKLTGKQGGFDLGVLSAIDTKTASYDGRQSPIYNVVRVQRDIGPQSRLGLVYTDKVEGDRWNRVLGLDGRWVRGALSVQAQTAASMTHADTTTSPHPLWNLSATVNRRHFYARYQTGGISTNFDAQSGFISRSGVANVQATHRYTWFGAAGAAVEQFVPEVFVAARWRYDDIVHRRNAQDLQLHFRSNTRLRGGWQVGAQALLESFGFDQALYANYAVFKPRAGGIDTLPYIGTKRLPNLDWVLSVGTPEFRRFSFNTFFIFGKDENFPEWSSADIVNVAATLNVRPSEQLRLASTVGYETYDRHSDGTRVLLRQVLRQRVEYQVTRQVFVRVIGEHSVLRQATLRDDSRTNAPVFLRSGTGTYAAATGFERARARLDFLFSYLPSPGTVFYLGYGDALASNRPVGPEQLQRARDVVFAKVSYLYRG